MKTAILVVLVISLILGIFFWRFGGALFSSKEEKVISLKYWGFEDERVMNALIKGYLNSRPNINIEYIKQSPLNYKTRLQTQLGSGEGPDMFKIHLSWLPFFLTDLSAAPSSLFSKEEYSKIFYPIISENLIRDGKIFGLPLEIDGLVLFYNEDILKAAGINPPENWQQFIEASKKVTVRNTEGIIETSGAALGTASNVDFWPEILGTLLLQDPRFDFKNPASQSGADVLEFYTSFVADPRSKVWDTTLPTSTEMFQNGKLAFYFAPASKASEIRVSSPNLNFKVVAVPQLTSRKVAWGTLWIEGVSGRSRNQKEAWEFLTYLATTPILQFVHDGRLQLGLSPKAYPRIDMAQLLATDQNLSAMTAVAPTLKTWYLNSNTQDASLNDEIIEQYKFALEQVLKGGSAKGALEQIAPQISEILTKYGAK